MKHLPLDNLETALRHQFANRALLEQALTHSSFARESPEPVGDNEQLEFLGDAVLQLVASQELFQRFPPIRRASSPSCAPISSTRVTSYTAPSIAAGQLSPPGPRRGEIRRTPQNRAALRRRRSHSGRALSRRRPLSGPRFVLSHILEPELERLSRNSGEVLVADHKSRLQELLQATRPPRAPLRDDRRRGTSASHAPSPCRCSSSNPANETEFATARQWQHQESRQPVGGAEGA